MYMKLNESEKKCKNILVEVKISFSYLKIHIF